MANAATRPDNTTASDRMYGQDYKQLVSYQPSLNHCFFKTRRRDLDLLFLRVPLIALQLYTSRSQKIGGFYDNRKEYYANKYTHPRAGVKIALRHRGERRSRVA